ncbi:MAG: ABC transporter substrate-binding protein [Acidobacteriota bacterium]
MVKTQDMLQKPSPRRLLERVESLCAALCILALLCASAACTPPTEQTAPDGETSAASTDDTIVIAVGVDMQGVNELIAPPTQLNSAIHYFSIFRPLFDEETNFRDGPPTFVPLLAASWQQAEDRLSWTVTLREEAVWSDGAPITADDVHFTWQAQTSPEVGWSSAEVKARIRDVEVVDAKTVRFHFTEAYATQLFDLNLGVILPRHVWGELPFSQWRESSQWFVDNLVVSGPFTLESWQPAQRITLRRNERYFEPGLPGAERVVFEVIPERASQLARLRAGGVHFVDFIRPAEAESIENDPELKLLSYLPRAYYFIAWNATREPFDDPAVRRALTLGINRQQIVDSLFYGYADVPSSPLAADTWVHHDELEPWPYDPQRAQEILTERGFTDSDGDGVLDRDGEPLRFELMTNADNDLRRDVITMVQSQLERIGVAVETRTMEFNALLEPLENQRFDAVMQALGIGTDFDLRPHYHTRASENGFNWGGYSNPEMDRLLEEIAATEDVVETLPLFREVQEILHQDQPQTLIYASPRLLAARRELRDVEPDAVSPFHHVARWRLAADDSASNEPASGAAE